MDVVGWRAQAIAIVVDDGNGYRSVYVHLAKSTVKAGDAVSAGDLLGYEGSTGNSTGCHLHYALFNPLERATIALDPKVAEKSKLPATEIARIDPFAVMPLVADAGITWGWGAGEPEDGAQP
jgi:murein DD-endopeptidase MepM/ murein hydrolase activator NlpD